MNKVILIVLDGLRYDVARACLGYMEGLVAAGRADVRKLTCELPAMSRPLYETLLTGRKPVDHGVVSNGVVRRSTGDNLFSRVRAQGGVTAAAAYHWVSELYVSCPFDRYRDRILATVPAISPMACSTGTMPILTAISSPMPNGLSGPRRRISSCCTR